MYRGITREERSRKDVDRLVGEQDKLKKWTISSNELINHRKLLESRGKKFLKNELLFWIMRRVRWTRIKTKGSGSRQAPGGTGSIVASSPSGICPCLQEHPGARERAAGPQPHPDQDMPTIVLPCQQWASHFSNCLCASKLNLGGLLFAFTLFNCFFCCLESFEGKWLFQNKFW